MEDEIYVGQVEGIREDTIDFMSDLTYDDLLNAIEEENISGGIDVMIIGKRIGSGKKSREVGANWHHFESSEELFTFPESNQDVKSVSDSLEMFQELFHLPELPEKIVGFVIRPT